MDGCQIRTLFCMPAQEPNREHISCSACQHRTKCMRLVSVMVGEQRPARVLWAQAVQLRSPHAEHPGGGATPAGGVWGRSAREPALPGGHGAQRAGWVKRPAAKDSPHRHWRASLPCPGSLPGLVTNGTCAPQTLFSFSPEGGLVVVVCVCGLGGGGGTEMPPTFSRLWGAMHFKSVLQYWNK
jgi:hypothetical protein